MIINWIHRPPIFVSWKKLRNCYFYIISHVGLVGCRLVGPSVGWSLWCCGLLVRLFCKLVGSPPVWHYLYYISMLLSEHLFAFILDEKTNRLNLNLNSNICLSRNVLLLFQDLVITTTSVRLNVVHPSTKLARTNMYLPWLIFEMLFFWT